MGEMSILIDRFDTIARPLLQALLNSFWQGMIIVALAWLLLRIFKRASATTRHAVWMVSLLTIGMLPFLAIYSMLSSSSTPQPVKQSQNVATFDTGPPFFMVTRPESNPPVVEDRIALPDFRYLPVHLTLITNRDRAAQLEETTISRIAENPQSAIRNPQSTASRTAEKSLWQGLQANFFKGRVPVTIVCLWLIICSLAILQIARCYFSLFLLRRQLGFVASEQRDRVQRLAEIFGIRRRVRIFTCKIVTVPMTIGAFRPIIILPSDLTGNLSPAEFESVIAHELAHIKRWDYMTNLLQRIVQSYLFFHPAVWLISKQLMIERELACDDWAVKTCEPRRYACCLAKLVELLSESKSFITATGIMFGKHVISRRVEMILNRERNATTAVSKPALVYAIGLAALFVCVCSSISPVIAVPLAQDRAAQQQPGKETKATTRAPTKSQELAPVPLPPLPPLPEPPIDVPDLSDLPDAPVIPAPAHQPQAPVVAATVEPVEGVFSVPEPSVAPIASTVFAPVAQPAIANWANLQQPTPVPVATTIAGGGPAWIQDDKNKTSVISETELLNVLTDIVKRDADPAVRNEALQGIYRIRSDAAINTLISLYDGASDVKVKGEIIGYLLRRNGDNTKATAKLLAIAKSEPNEELRIKAVRYLASIKGDDGANNLIQIYDGLQDSKMKQTLIRYLAYNKSRKAVDKLIQIAKNDTDPAVRQAAIRSLYGIDNRLYLEFVDRDRPKKIGLMDNQLKQLELDKLNDQIFDLKKAQELQEQILLEFPKIEFDFKEFQKDWELNWPEMKKKIEEKEKEKTKPRVQQNVAPAPRVKAARTASIS